MKFFNRKQREVQPEVRRVVETRVVQGRPDMTKFVEKDVILAALLEDYYKIAMDIEPYIGKGTNRELVMRKLGQMDQINTTIALVDGIDLITAVFQADRYVEERKIAAGFYTEEQVKEYRKGRAFLRYERFMPAAQKTA